MSPIGHLQVAGGLCHQNLKVRRGDSLVAQIWWQRRENVGDQRRQIGLLAVSLNHQPKIEKPACVAVSDLGRQPDGFFDQLERPTRLDDNPPSCRAKVRHNFSQELKGRGRGFRLIETLIIPFTIDKNPIARLSLFAKAVVFQPFWSKCPLAFEHVQSREFRRHVSLECDEGLPLLESQGIRTAGGGNMTIIIKRQSQGGLHHSFFPLAPSLAELAMPAHAKQAQHRHGILALAYLNLHGLQDRNGAARKSRQPGCHFGGDLGRDLWRSHQDMQLSGVDGRFQNAKCTRYGICPCRSGQRQAHERCAGAGANQPQFLCATVLAMPDKLCRTRLLLMEIGTVPLLPTTASARGDATQDRQKVRWSSLQVFWAPKVTRLAASIGRDASGLKVAEDFQILA